MKITLLHPPLDDPTLPYHSTAYLAGHLAHNGFTDVAIRDLNIEFVNWCLQESIFHSFREEAERQIKSFEKSMALSFRDQDAFYSLWAPQDIRYQEIEKAVRGMRDLEAFLDFSEYKDNVNILLRYLSCLGALSYPAEIVNFRLQSRGRFSAYNLTDLFDVDLTRRVCFPFDRYLREVVKADRELARSDCLGISVVYDHQIFPALHLARWFKDRWPDKTILLGGTSISQYYKYLKDKSAMRHFFSICDGLVVGEGETAICQIAEAGGVEPGAKVRNLISYDARKDQLHLPDHVHYESVPALGRPAYDYDWELYLAPGRGINYAPTRGCYWNKCTFCDYGLNTDMPTSPWRERKIDQVIEDLRVTIDQHHASYVYFAVDVMSPKYLDWLSDAILESGLRFRWSAELRMEKVFSKERCRKLAESGCVCASFGMESGSQRVLDLIDKGTKVEFMARTMKNFSEAGIAVQLMAFTDFPGETEAEKQETFDFVEEHDDYWAAGGMGTFLLTGTAILAKNPDKFGVKLVDTVDADFARALAWDLNKEETSQDKLLDREQVLTEDADASFDEDGGVFPAMMGRPWAGGTDTLHSMIYYQHKGQRFFRDKAFARGNHADFENPREFLDHTLFLPGQLKASSFDLAPIIHARQEFSRHLGEMSKIPQEPTLKSYRRWAEKQEVLSPNPQGVTYWIRGGDKCLRIDELIYRLLRIGVDNQLTIRQLCQGLKGPTRDRVLKYLDDLRSVRLLEFDPPGGSEEEASSIRASSEYCGTASAGRPTPARRSHDPELESG